MSSRRCSRLSHQLSHGTFFCPHCKDLRPYTRKPASRYFTLYVIPVFETKNMREYVECQTCQSGFHPKSWTSNQAYFKSTAKVIA